MKLNKSFNSKYTNPDNTLNVPTELEMLDDNKVSFISKPSQVHATRIDLSAPSQVLHSMGLVFEDGQWYVPNREHFPSPLTQNSVLIQYSPKDIGFCDVSDFLQKYVSYTDFTLGQVVHIEKEQLPINSLGCIFTKYSNIFISMVTPGTRLQTNQGEIVSSASGVLAIKETQDGNEYYEISIETFLTRYMPDPMSPTSTVAYSLLEDFHNNHGEDMYPQYLEKYRRIDKDKESYQHYFAEFSEALDLRDKYKYAIQVAKYMQSIYEPILKHLTFSQKLKKAQSLLDEINKNNQLSPIEKQLRVKYILIYLLPKTNNHQHLKGSVPIETVKKLAMQKGLDLNQIDLAYQKAINGFDTLDEFSSTYGIIAQSIKTIQDYKVAIQAIIEEAITNEQITVEIRCSLLGLRDDNGNAIKGIDAGHYLFKSINEIVQQKGELAPKVGFTILGYRGRDWVPEEVYEHAQLAIELARTYPSFKFSFDLAGPEDTGYPAIFFKQAFDSIYKYNQNPAGETVGITIHAGETPTYDNGREGHLSVREAIQVESDRIGHAVRAVDDLETLNMLKADGATVEICGVCNVLSIPVNTQHKAIHPVDELQERDIPITICTDNDAICGTNIINEYMLFLLTGHDELASWDTVVEIARHGVECSFISDADKSDALKLFDTRLKLLNHLLKTHKILSTTKISEQVTDSVKKVIKKQ